MYGACNQLFACACFTGDENRRITRCDFGDERENTFQSGRCSNDLVKHRGFVDFFTLSDVFLTKLVFRLLAVFNIGSGNKPTPNLSPFVMQRIVIDQKPAILSVVSPQPRFVLVRGTAMRSPLDLFQIIRMKPRLSVFTLPLLKAEAEIIQQGSVGKNGFFHGPYDGDLLRREVQNLLELHLLLPDLLFRPLLLA